MNAPAPDARLIDWNGKRYTLFPLDGGGDVYGVFAQNDRGDWHPLRSLPAGFPAHTLPPLAVFSDERAVWVPA